MGKPHSPKQKLSSFSKKKIKEMLSKEGIAKPLPSSASQTTVKGLPAKSHTANGKTPTKSNLNIYAKVKIESMNTDQNVGFREERSANQGRSAKSHTANGKTPTITKSNMNIYAKVKIDSMNTDKNVGFREERSTNLVPSNVTTTIPIKKKHSPSANMPTNAKKMSQSSANRGANSKSDNWSIQSLSDKSNDNTQSANTKKRRTFTVEELADTTNTTPGNKRKFAGNQQHPVAKKIHFSKAPKKKQQMNKFDVTDIRPGDFQRRSEDSDDSNVDSYMEQFFNSDTDNEKLPKTTARSQQMPSEVTTGAKPKTQFDFDQSIESDSESDDLSDDSMAKETNNSDKKLSETTKDDGIESITSSERYTLTEEDTSDDYETQSSDSSELVQSNSIIDTVKTVLNGNKTASKHTRQESTSSEDNSSEYDEHDDTYETAEDSDEEDMTSYTDDSESSYAIMSSDDALYSTFLNGKWQGDSFGDDDEYKSKQNPISVPYKFPAYKFPFPYSQLATYTFQRVTQSTHRYPPMIPINLTVIPVRR